MRIIGIAGWSGSGKTTLLTKVIPRIVARGLKMSTIKHAHHSFDMDQPGKDSHATGWRARPRCWSDPARGGRSCTSCAANPSRHSPSCVEKITPVDLVLVEGYKRESHPKLEVYRASVGKPLLHPGDPAIVAIASDEPLPNVRIPVVDLNDVEGISDILLRHAMPVSSLAALTT